MSAPPPGGSPPPQPPPQYPPQSYPPQYPQQPYYPQAAPPPERSNTVLIVVVVVVVLVVVLALAVWWAMTALIAPVTQTGITVTAASFSINYPGSNHWFGPSPITSCSNCPIKTTLLSQFSYTLTLHNVDTVAHNVTAVRLTGVSFTIVSSAPDPSTASPVRISAGGTQTIILTVQPTTISGGSYTLAGVIDTN